MTSVSIKLTAEQQEGIRVQLQQSRTKTSSGLSFSAIVKLTAGQFREVKKHFPALESRDLTIQYSTTAPFVPGGAVVTGAISSRAGVVSAVGSASDD